LTKFSIIFISKTKRLLLKTFFVYEFYSSSPITGFLLAGYIGTTLYKSIILPHFDFCASVLYLMDKTKVGVLQKLQNRGMRIILKCNKYTPIRLMLSTLQWMSVEQRLYYMSMIFMFKMVRLVDKKKLGHAKFLTFVSSS
jgi:hypothetical protein